MAREASKINKAPSTLLPGGLVLLCLLAVLQVFSGSQPSPAGHSRPKTPTPSQGKPQTDRQARPIPAGPVEPPAVLLEGDGTLRDTGAFIDADAPVRRQEADDPATSADTGPFFDADSGPPVGLWDAPASVQDTGDALDADAPATPNDKATAAVPSDTGAFIDADMPP